MATGWTASEDATLRALYGKVAYEEIATAVGKSYLQVRYRAKLMGLGKPGGCIVSPKDEEAMNRWRQEVFG